MSWQVSAIGRPAAVLTAVAQNIATMRCLEPEQTIKTLAGDLIEKALAAYPEGAAVEVTASGSQSNVGQAGEAGKAVNSLTITIKPLWNFLG